MSRIFFSDGGNFRLSTPSQNRKFLSLGQMGIPLSEAGLFACTRACPAAARDFVLDIKMRHFKSGSVIE